LIAIVDSDASSKDANIETNSEISWEHGSTRSILLEDHLALEEDALRSTAVNLAGLANHD
jgi:hypothetical protein